MKKLILEVADIFGNEPITIQEIKVLLQVSDNQPDVIRKAFKLSQNRHTSIIWSDGSEKCIEEKWYENEKVSKFKGKDAGRSADDTGSLSGIHRRARKGEKSRGIFLRKAELLPKWYTKLSGRMCPWDAICKGQVASRGLLYTMSQVQICACTRICTWRMYIIELLSEIVYKVYESVGVSLLDCLIL